ncbi:MAG: triphosphoribosyl-dephospho-CoA synthase [Methyloceanibacter sp.]
MSKTPKSSSVAQGFVDVCRAELDALKPGNVHRLSGDPRMSVADFERSAEAASPAMGKLGLAVGRRIRLAVEATRQAVGHNTNLGIILLAAPLAQAALGPGRADLRSRLTRVLGELGVEDAREAYRAIRTAQPGGLGEAPEHDVMAEPTVTLLEAMRAAQARDRIAWNYANDYVDIFDLGLKWWDHASQRWSPGPWAVTRVYLGFLTHIPDTLIERKFGENTASEIMDEARPIEAGLVQCADPNDMKAPLLAFDNSLKQRGLNPGTSADLTVATLFAAVLQNEKMAE